MRALCLSLAILLGGLVLQPAFAGPASDHRDSSSDSREHGRRNDGRMSPSEAAQIAQQRHGGGRVLAVDPSGNGYRVKLLQRGDVHVVFIPAE